VAIFVFGASALVGAFGKRLMRIIGLAVMPLAFAGIILSLSHHEAACSFLTHLGSRAVKFAVTHKTAARQWVAM
jgi:hypothetical protein